MKKIDRKWYSPDFRAVTVADMDMDLLERLGIRSMALDVDSTLLPHGGLEITEMEAEKLRRMRVKHKIDKIVLATNRRRDNLSEIAAAVGADAVVRAHGFVFKPRRKYFDELLLACGCRPEEAVMVGDRWIQDVVGGNMAGMTTILVEPLGAARWLDKVLMQRRLQRIIMRWLNSG